MKTRIRLIAAALAVSGTYAFAQSGPAPAPDAAPPTPREAPIPFVNQPVASTTGAEGPNAEAANAIAQALNAAAPLKHSKVTVQAEEASILLTGSTATEVQKQHAHKLAMQHANGAPVVNLIASDENVIDVTGLVPQDVATIEVLDEPETQAQPQAQPAA